MTAERGEGGGLCGVEEGSRHRWRREEEEVREEAEDAAWKDEVGGRLVE